jgi:hypothetical protein
MQYKKNLFYVMFGYLFMFIVCSGYGKTRFSPFKDRANWQALGAKSRNSKAQCMASAISDTTWNDS